MPAVEQFGSCAIYVYADHNPPHFHIEGPDWTVTINLRDFSEMDRDGKVGRGPFRDALEWAKDNPGVIWAEWSRINERE